MIATIPAVLVGALAADAIQEHLGEPWQIAIFLAVFGVLLYLADRLPVRRSMGDLGPRHALFMGVAQSLALMPGVSRSGITITAGRTLGLDRDSAARFSFLLLVPTVAGAAIYTGLKDVILGDLPAGWKGPFVVGILSAAGSGLLAIHWLLGYVRQHNYTVFVVYRLILGGGHPAPHRHGRPRGDVLAPAGPSGPGASLGRCGSSSERCRRLAACPAACSDWRFSACSSCLSA